MFSDCPKEPIKVSGPVLPMQVMINLPVATDNSGIDPVITVDPDFTQPYEAYEVRFTCDIYYGIF